MPNGVFVCGLQITVTASLSPVQLHPTCVLMPNSTLPMTAQVLEMVLEELDMNVIGRKRCPARGGAVGHGRAAAEGKILTIDVTYTESNGGKDRHLNTYVNINDDDWFTGYRALLTAREYIVQLKDSSLPTSTP